MPVFVRIYFAKLANLLILVSTGWKADPITGPITCHHVLQYSSFFSKMNLSSRANLNHFAPADLKQRCLWATPNWTLKENTLKTAAHLLHLLTKLICSKTERPHPTNAARCLQLWHTHGRHTLGCNHLWRDERGSEKLKHEKSYSLAWSTYV